MRRNHITMAAWMMLTVTAGLSGLANANPEPNDAATAQLNEATGFFTRLAHSENPVIAELAKDSLNRLQTDDPVRHVSVPLLSQPDGSLMVPTILEGRVAATFMLDTGASYTVITPATAKRMGLVITANTERVPLITANGRTTAPLVTLKSIRLGAQTVSNVKAIVQDLGSEDEALLAGLLGMNVFQGMDITLKQDKLILGLHAPKADSLQHVQFAGY